MNKTNKEFLGMYNAAVIHRIRIQMVRRGITRKELSRRTGLSERTLYRYFNGKCNRFEIK